MLPANDVASVIIARSGRPWLDAWSLQKLLYYVQAWHLAITDQPLFDEPIKAWRDGPVVPSVRYERMDQATRRAADQQLEGVDLDDATSDLIDLVLAAYGSMAGEELRALTHVEQPWLEARGDLPHDAECREPIDEESMKTFYREHRMLGGRTAADLAVGGIHLRAQADHRGPVDIAALLADVPDPALDDDADDPWGSANLDDGSRYESDGIVTEAHRVYASA